MFFRDNEEWALLWNQHKGNKASLITAERGRKKVGHKPQPLRNLCPGGDPLNQGSCQNEWSVLADCRQECSGTKGIRSKRCYQEECCRNGQHAHSKRPTNDKKPSGGCLMIKGILEQG